MHDSRAKNLMWVGASSRFCREALTGLGGMALEQWVAVRYLAAVLGTTLFLSVQPRRWGRVERGIFARQFFFFGVESVRFILIVAVLVGISVVVQLGVWTDRLGQSQKLGPLLVVVVARELGPLFANFVLIVRGGSAIATELGIMKVGGEVRVLEAQGLEPLLFLVMPRVLAMALSAFCLTIIFVLAAFASGYGFSALFGGINMVPEVFLNSVFKAVHPLDAIGFLVKCILPAVLTGVICSTEGLSVEGGVTQVPLAAKRALARSLFALFVTSTVVSLLTYS
ncbi:MAG TPA: ABC transporter permease [Candidatus Baltobacteraceae bacterium]|jgi:phospholipid/cholesterol/gamma-HCH transport system permease protein|nr:ABC transporter permease [Candidatus Baltobacteraceae bacterium]